MCSAVPRIIKAAITASGTIFCYTADEYKVQYTIPVTLRYNIRYNSYYYHVAFFCYTPRVLGGWGWVCNLQYYEVIIPVTLRFNAGSFPKVLPHARLQQL